MKILELINIGSNLLKANKIPSHIIDSELLLSKTLRKPREELLINLDDIVDESKYFKFKEYLARRSRSEPLAYILEEKEFWSKKFKVNKHTLIPRPETELLVDKLLKIFHGKRISILDVGTGSGCIIVSLLLNLKKSKGIGMDVSKEAILVASKNGMRFNLQDRLKFLNKPFGSFLNQRFDLIVSNPPYIERKDLKNLSDDIKKYEPKIALDGGNDGLDLIKKVIYKSKNILKNRGTLALEIGNEQVRKVSKILLDNNFRVKHEIKDYKNNVRCLISSYN